MLYVFKLLSIYHFAESITADIGNALGRFLTLLLLCHEDGALIIATATKKQQQEEKMSFLHWQDRIVQKRMYNA